MRFLVKMSHHTKIDENIEGVDNFRAWKYRISLVLEENDLDSYISEEVPVPEGYEANVGDIYHHTHSFWSIWPS